MTKQFSNYQNESTITIKMKAFIDLFRKNTITMRALQALFLYFNSLILKVFSKYLPIQEREKKKYAHADREKQIQR